MIAITGGIAEGKSTVLEHLAGLGYTTASSDAFARVVFDLPEVQTEIAELIGDGRPTRDRVRTAIAAKPELRRGLNRLMHGRIWALIEAESPQFVEVPLLIETCLQTRFEWVWVVTCGAEEQRRRLLDRLGDPNLVDQLLQVQLPTRVKLAFADRIVRTNGERGSVLEFVKTVADADCALR